MRHLLPLAAFLAWVLIQVPTVICVSDCDGTSFVESVLVHHHEGVQAPDGHGHRHACRCSHDHSKARHSKARHSKARHSKARHAAPQQSGQNEPADRHHDRHVIVHAESCQAGGAVILDAPSVEIALDTPPVALATAQMRTAVQECDVGPPWAADPVSAFDRILV